MSKPRVAMLGLGIMGSGMAGRLLAAGFPLVIYNRSKDRAKPFVDAGAVLADTPREAASNADIVISMVADDDASRAVWLGENGALAGAARGSVLIESSTLTPAWIAELAALSSQQGCELLDAPVTGTKSHAAAGELVFLVGGSEQALMIARPALAAMGRDVIHFGPSGAGATMKLINNFMAGVQAASLAEAVSLIQASGLDRDKAVAVLMNGAPGSPMIKTVWARASARDFTPNFVLKLMAKDLRYAAEEGTRQGLALQTPVAALAVFNQAIAGGYGDKDISAVLESGARSSRK